MRALIGALFVAVALWLIPDKQSDSQVLAIGIPALAVGGFIAGWRTAWAAVPLGTWVLFATFAATDCADCRGGGEQVDPPLVVYVVLTLIFAAIGMAGAGVALVVIRRRPPVPASVAVSCGAMLAVLFVGLAAVRAYEQHDRSGDVVFERFGIRFREGNAVPDPVRAISSAASGLNGEAPLWLGDQVGRFNLATVQTGPNFLLVYGKCGPAPCTPPVTVMHRWSCGTPPEVEFARSPVETRSDGVVILRNAAGGDERSGVTKAVVWSGHLEVTIYAQDEAASADDLADQVRRVDGLQLAAAASSC